jgi:hypothetical protein
VELKMANKLLIQIDDEVIELKGLEKDSYIKQLEKDQAEIALLEAEYKAKQDSRKSAIKKLAEIAGLTKDELNAIF